MLKKLIVGIILNGAALYGVLYFLSEIHYSGGMYFFALGGFVMGVLNTVVKPVLKLFSFPLQIITLGLSLIILNGIIFWIFKIALDTLAIQEITMNVPSILSYFLAGLLFGIINWLEHLVIHNK